MVAHLGPAQDWALSSHYCGRDKQSTLLQDDKHRKCSQQCCHLSVQCPVSRPSNRRRHPHCLYTLPQITPIFLLKTGQGFLLEGHLFKVNTPRAPRQTVMAPLFLVRVAKVECLTQDQDPFFTSRVPQPPPPSLNLKGGYQYHSCCTNRGCSPLGGCCQPGGVETS